MKDFSFYPLSPDFEKPPVGVSACLLGEKVRYDGQHKHNPMLALLAEHLELIPVCPEVAAGLGVPRPPVQLVASSGQTQALGVEQQQLDATAALTETSERLARQTTHWCGAILKARSPSCGMGTTPIHNKNREPTHFGDGLFAAALCQYCPALAIADENTIAKTELNFLWHTHLLQDWRSSQALPTPFTLADFLGHHRHHAETVLGSTEAFFQAMADYLRQDRPYRTQHRQDSDYSTNFYSSK